MYSIKQASARTGIPIPLLRAWETRYRIVEPRRTAARYRLYDDEAIDRLRSLGALCAAAWTPSSAAGAILAGDAPRLAPVTDGVTSPDGNSADGEGTESRIEAFVAAAVALDSVRLERVLDDMFGGGSLE